MLKEFLNDKKVFFSIILIFVSGLLFSQHEKEKENHIESITLKSVKKYKNKKENPAYAIMQQVWKKKKSNGLLLHKDYQFRTYERIVFLLNNLDSTFTKKGVFKGMGSTLSKYNDSTQSNGRTVLPLFLSENISDTYGKNNPQKERKDIIAVKTSGFNDNEIVTNTVNSFFKDINIFDNSFSYLNIGFTSPISTDGFAVFDYNIIDTIQINTTPCYHIRFTPKNPDALAFKGQLYITKDTYNVLKVDMKTNKNININFVKSISTELEFDSPDDSTFIPTRSEMTLDLALSEKETAKNIIAKRTSTYSKYLFDTGIKDDFLYQVVLPADNIGEKDDDFWKKNRTEILTKSEDNIYKMYHELENNSKYKSIVKTIEILGSGYIPIGKTGIDFGQIFHSLGYNDVEGLRLRAGARTYFSHNDMWRIQGYTAYGLRDKKLKYAAEAKYMFNKTNRFLIGVGTRKDVLQLGAQLTTDEGIMTRSFASSSVINSGKTTSMSSLHQYNLFTSIEPWRNIQIKLDAIQQNIKSADPSRFNINYYKDGVLRTDLNDTRLVATLIAKPGTQYSTHGVDRNENRTLVNNPTIILKYTKGFSGIFNSDFNYNKLQFYYYQPMILGNWGRLFANFEAGKNFESLPLALQNVLPANQSYGLQRGVFSLMNYYEFVADSYAVLFLEHHFNGKILSQIPFIKKLKLREIVFFRSGIGSLKEQTKSMYAGDILLNAPEKPYYEYGFGIENIGWGNFRILRFDFNWRGNYLDHKSNSDIRKFGIQFGFKFRF